MQTFSLFILLSVCAVCFACGDKEDTHIEDLGGGFPPRAFTDYNCFSNCSGDSVIETEVCVYETYELKCTIKSDQCGISLTADLADGIELWAAEGFSLTVRTPVGTFPRGWEATVNASRVKDMGNEFYPNGGDAEVIESNTILHEGDVFTMRLTLSDGSLPYVSALLMVVILLFV
eukprot:TRINITY_DN3312_c0_g1_i1.p1 TRINITY_DN3312_c0_g1~~TRINITY_DN3312_c0_g1_i1.p1  ORF type:complete len:175 (+),score=18.06 TRINITY_DN3312_c0_g1_i1:72-596(+)